MTCFLAFKLVPMEWYLSYHTPKDPYIAIDVQTIWNNANGQSDQYARLQVSDGKITKVTLCNLEPSHDDCIYVSLTQIFMPKTSELPTLPVDDD